MSKAGVVAAVISACGCVGAPEGGAEQAAGPDRQPHLEVRRVTVTSDATAAVPVSGRVAFHSDRAGRNRLFVLDLPSRHATELTGGPDYHAESPAWSPDCRAVAYATTAFDHATYDLAVLDVHGAREPRRLTSHPAFERHPAWTPDGTGLFFTSDQDGPQAVFRLTLTNGDIQRVSPGRERALMGAPAGGSGRRMAMVLGSAQGLRVVVHEGDTEAVALTPPGTTAADPRWSPDGAHLAFARLTPESAVVGVWTAASGRIQEIAVDGVAEMREPTWSPDGRWLMVAGRAGADWDLLLLSADGTHASWMTNGAANDRAPAWMPC